MTKFIEVIKQVALAAVESKKPVEVCYGTVIALTPFTVRLSQKQILTGEYFEVRDGVYPSSFRQGDELILIRFQGGQKFLIFGKKGAL